MKKKRSRYILYIDLNFSFVLFYSQVFRKASCHETTRGFKAAGDTTQLHLKPWTESQKHFKNGLSQRKVYEKYNIARSSFQNHVKVVSSARLKRKPGGQTVLSPDEEDSIVNHLVHMSGWGFLF